MPAGKGLPLSWLLQTPRRDSIQPRSIADLPKMNWEGSPRINSFPHPWLPSCLLFEETGGRTARCFAIPP